MPGYFLKSYRDDSTFGVSWAWSGKQKWNEEKLYDSRMIIRLLLHCCSTFSPRHERHQHLSFSLFSWENKYRHRLFGIGCEQDTRFTEYIWRMPTDLNMIKINVQPQERLLLVHWSRINHSGIPGGSLLMDPFTYFSMGWSSPRSQSMNIGGVIKCYIKCHSLPRVYYTSMLCCWRNAYEASCSGRLKRDLWQRDDVIFN